MSPDALRAQYRDLMQRRGELLGLRRVTGTVSQVYFQIEVLAVPAMYDPRTLVGATKEGRTDLIVLADDVFAAQFPVPLRTGDKAVLGGAGGKVVNIEKVDDNSRRVAGELIAYVLTVQG